MNRIELAGRLIQSASDTIDGKQVAAFMFSFPQGRQPDGTVRVVVGEAALIRKIFNLPCDAEIAVSGKLGSSDSGLWIEAHDIRSLDPRTATRQHSQQKQRAPR
jgi:hypothetical protein